MPDSFPDANAAGLPAELRKSSAGSAQTPIRVTYLVPSTDEASQFEEWVRELHSDLSRRHPGQFEIVILNCTGTLFEPDETLSRIKALTNDFPEVRSFRVRRSQTKIGAALHAGFFASKGEWVFLMNRSQNLTPEICSTSEQLLGKGHDLVYLNPGQILAVSRGFAESAFRFQTCPTDIFHRELSLIARLNGFSEALLPQQFTVEPVQKQVEAPLERIISWGWALKIAIRKRMGKYSLQKQILKEFRSAPRSVRAYLNLRWKFTPYANMAKYLPQKGRILDLGSGYGLFSMVVASVRPASQVIGVDHDVKKIGYARHAAKSSKNLKFINQDLRKEAPIEGLSAVSMLDVLHYFRFDEQERILRRAKESLAPGGMLLIREVDRTFWPRSMLNRLYERISVTLGWTRTTEKICRFRKRSEWAAVLEGLGFEVVSKRCSSVFFSDTLFIATLKS